LVFCFHLFFCETTFQQCKHGQIFITVGAVDTTTTTTTAATTRMRQSTTLEPSTTGSPPAGVYLNV
jgi:hypothetical protein